MTDSYTIRKQSQSQSQSQEQPGAQPAASEQKQGKKLSVRLLHLRSLRLGRKLTMEEMGKLLGVEKSTYCNYETGVREPRVEFWLEVSRVFDVSLEWLLDAEIRHKSVTESVTKSVTAVSADEVAAMYALLSDEDKTTVCRVIEAFFKKVCAN